MSARAQWAQTRRGKRYREPRGGFKLVRSGGSRSTIERERAIARRAERAFKIAQRDG